MADEIIGKVVEGKITNVANFGAFVTLETGEDGLVHISEIANEFITNISDFVKVGDQVKVLVLARNEKKKLELSLKKVDANATTESKKDNGNTKTDTKPVRPKPKSNNFEDKLGSFMKRSEERQIDIRRNLKNKQGITKRKRI